MRRTVFLSLPLAVTLVALGLWTSQGVGHAQTALPIPAVATACRDVSVPVAVGGQHGSIAGTLCTPTGATTVQLLVPGWTYNRFYWDLPYQPDTYSYVRAANRAGYATLAIDRLGTGASLHPPSIAVTLQAAGRILEFAERYVGHGNGAVGTKLQPRPKVVGAPQGQAATAIAPVNDAQAALAIAPVNDAQAALAIAPVNDAQAAAALSLGDAYNALVEPIPGLGDTGHSNPLITALLARIANLTNEASGNLSQDLLDN